MVYRWREMNEQNRQVKQSRQRLTPFPLSLALSHEGRGDASQSSYLLPRGERGCLFGGIQIVIVVQLISLRMQDI